jgi:hypothetical protein
VRHLEKIIQELSNELAAERERLRINTRHTAMLKGQAEKAERKAQTNGLLHDAAKRRLTEALALLGAADREVLELRKLVHEATAMAPDRAVPTQAGASDDLLTALRKVSSGLGDMAVHEMDAARRWAVKREKYLAQERQKLLSALDAMQFVTQMSEPEVRQGMIISTLKRRRRPIVAPPSSPHPTPDEATVTASSPFQRLSGELLRGVLPSEVT